MQKKVFWFNFIYGYVKQLSDRFSLDVYTGLGVRFRMINTVSKEYDKKRDNGIIHPIDLNINSIRQETDANAGYTVTPGVSLGLRVCYRL